MKEKIHEIIEGSLALFMQFGIKSLTMDDISQKLGISKKTLYQSVENKEDLINKVITFILMKEAEVMGVIRKKAKDAIEEVVMISRHVNKMLQAINPAAMYDLQKYYTQQFDLKTELKPQPLGRPRLDQSQRAQLCQTDCL